MKQLITMLKSPTVFVNDKDASLIYPLLLHILNVALIMLFINSGLDVFNVAGNALIAVSIFVWVLTIISVSYNELPFSDYLNLSKQWFKLTAIINLFVTALILITDLMHVGKGEFVYGITLGIVLMIVLFYLNYQPLYFLLNNKNKKMENSSFLFLLIISISLTTLIFLFLLMQYFLFIKSVTPSYLGGAW